MYFGKKYVDEGSVASKKHLTDSPGSEIGPGGDGALREVHGGVGDVRDGGGGGHPTHGIPSDNLSRIRLRSEGTKKYVVKCFNIFLINEREFPLPLGRGGEGQSWTKFKTPELAHPLTLGEKVRSEYIEPKHCSGEFRTPIFSSSGNHRLISLRNGNTDK